ncbi:uncharacterized protein LOC125666402 [Ostrea edulis]|uniref:uncharacterized protein LOC125666402 n=1 Tax=Ostrea edulis TaxID=37623 RepID=UPI0024AEE6C5|nr:uncharacterized protein LOC125666402 [Ostrea edulis]
MDAHFSQLIILRQFIVLFLTGLLCRNVNCLMCWKCIGKECNGQDYEDYSQKVHCDVGESCMKVVYEMVDYPSPAKYESVVRTCSRGTCSPITSETFNVCRGKHRSYRFKGCTIRTCCDGNLCNAAPGLYFESYFCFISSVVWIRLIV